MESMFEKNLPENIAYNSFKIMIKHSLWKLMGCKKNLDRVQEEIP